MERRDFIKISMLTGAAAALDGCGKPDQQLIRFLPEEELVPGVATWKPSICPACPAGCGVVARVMEGEAEVVREGRPGVIRMGLAKKLEGNPEHPVSQGKLCPRGQASLQITYNPDRLKNPLKRAGPRGSGQFQEITWDEGIRELAERLRTPGQTGLAAAAAGTENQTPLMFLARPLRGQRRALIERFLAALGAPRMISFALFDDAVLRQANWLSFGRYQLPTFDLARSNYVISFGADFLGTWNSPVAQSAAYGKMRRGRPGVRGKFVQVEPRMSQTGANADEWVPARPGTEGALALGLAHVILKQARNSKGENRRASAATREFRVSGFDFRFSEGLPGYSPAEVEKKTGVEAGRIERLARELEEHPPAVAMIGGAPLGHTNGLFNALAVNALNAVLGSLEKPGGIFFTPLPPAFSSASTGLEPGPAGAHAVRALAERLLTDQPPPVQALLLYEANPVFAAPGAWRVEQALEKVPFIASFGSFLDETSSLADLILPDHSFLESWLDDIGESGTMQAVASLAPPAMRPLHNTRALTDVLLETARRLGGRVAAALPWKSYEEMLRAAFAPLQHKPGSVSAESEGEFWAAARRQGGWWSGEAEGTPHKPANAAAPAGAPTSRGAGPGAAGSARAERAQEAGRTISAEPQFDGGAEEFPFHFLPYASQQFLDGSLAHLPWLQEMPDALATAMWGTWIEIRSKTAERLGIRQGDLVEIVSRHGAVRAPALLSPGIAPDVVAMPVGQGHQRFGRYAGGRGANAVKVLAPLEEPRTGALAWAGTRVKIARVGEGRLILFAGGMEERPREGR